MKYLKRTIRLLSLMALVYIWTCNTSIIHAAPISIKASDDILPYRFSSITKTGKASPGGQGWATNNYSFTSNHYDLTPIDTIQFEFDMVSSSNTYYGQFSKINIKWYDAKGNEITPLGINTGTFVYADSAQHYAAAYGGDNYSSVEITRYGFARRIPYVRDDKGNSCYTAAQKEDEQTWRNKTGVKDAIPLTKTSFIAAVSNYYDLSDCYYEATFSYTAGNCTTASGTANFNYYATKLVPQTPYFSGFQAPSDLTVQNRFIDLSSYNQGRIRKNIEKRPW